MNRLHARLTFMCMLLGQAALAHAAFTDFVYFRPYNGEFLSSLQNAATDSFNDLTLGYQPAQLARNVGAYAYSVSAAGGMFVLGQSFGSPYDLVLSLSTGNVATSLTFNQFAGNASAIGMYIFATNGDGSLATTYPLSFTATDSQGAVIGSGILATYFGSSSQGVFFGLKSDSTIASFTISAPLDSGVFVSVDGLVLGIAAVPEPSTGLQLLAGLGVFGLVGVVRSVKRAHHRRPGRLLSRSDSATEAQSSTRALRLYAIR